MGANDPADDQSDARGFCADALIGAMYEYVFSPGTGCTWCGLLARLCQGMEAFAGGFVEHDFSTRQSMLRHHFNIHAGGADTCGESFFASGIWLDREILGGEGRVVPGDQRYPALGPEFAPNALNRSLHHLYGVISLSRAEAYLIGLYRMPEARPFAVEDEARLARLLPHLKRTRTLRLRVQRDRQVQESLAETLDRVPAGFLLVASTGRVEFSNRLAQAMLARGDGISLAAGGRVTTRFPGETAELRRLIRDLAAGADQNTGRINGHGGDATGGRRAHFMVSRGPGSLPLVCVLHGTGGMQAGDGTRTGQSVALLIKDPDSGGPADLADFAAVYRLTKAEARLTGLLVEGHGLFEAAGKLGITRNTARTHMRNIYAKIGTNRQADLVRLHGQLRIF